MENFNRRSFLQKGALSAAGLLGVSALVEAKP